MAVFFRLRPNSSLISLAISPVNTIENVLLGISKGAKTTKAPIPNKVFVVTVTRVINYL